MKNSTNPRGCYPGQIVYRSRLKQHSLVMHRQSLQHGLAGIDQFLVGLDHGEIDVGAHEFEFRQLAFIIRNFTQELVAQQVGAAGIDINFQIFIVFSHLYHSLDGPLLIELVQDQACDDTGKFPRPIRLEQMTIC